MFHDDDTPSECEATGRVFLFTEFVAYWSMKLDAAIAAGDRLGTLEAFCAESHACQMLDIWRGYLARARAKQVMA